MTNSQANTTKPLTAGQPAEGGPIPAHRRPAGGASESGGVDGTTLGVSRISFSVPGEPEGWKRAGHTIRRGRNGKPFVHSYTTHETRKYKELITLYARAHMPREKWDGPVRLDVTVYLERPHRLLKKSSPLGPIWCTTKPDRDNIEKAVLDALTDAGLWLDDKQVCAGEVQKFFVAIGSRPGLVIVASRLDEPTQLELPGVAP